MANVLVTCVQLNGGGLDPAHGLVAVAAARVRHRGRFVAIYKNKIGSLQLSLRAVQPMHAKPRCTAPDDIGYSSMDSEYKIDSSWKLVIMWRRRVRLASTTAST